MLYRGADARKGASDWRLLFVGERAFDLGEYGWRAAVGPEAT